MRYRKLGVLIAAVVACVTVPATASAQTEAACGTTPEQWVGYFPGFTSGDNPFNNVITLENGVLDVEEEGRGEDQAPPYGTPTLDGNSLNWIYADTYPSGPGFSEIFTTENVTCANGVVQSFSGTMLFFFSDVLGSPLLDAEIPFSATRA